MSLLLHVVLYLVILSDQTFSPPQTLVTDGKTQSAQFDEFAYHESLVHPGLLKVSSQTGDKKLTVFIGGGGELATARECLRHTAVERIVMVDLDERVIELCKEHLPEWGGKEVAENPRLELIVGDAFKYLQETKDVYDVIIMDISDPIEAGPGVMLYTKEFYEHAQSLLAKPHGIFVTQAGLAESIPAEVVKKDGVDLSCFPPIYNTMKQAFPAVLPYTLHVPSYSSDWGYIMASVSEGLVEEWKIPKAGLVDQLIEERIEGGNKVLDFYDGETHVRMFSLTKPLRKLIAQDSRIMTKDNPIFMY